MSDLRNMSLSKSVGEPKLGAANSDSDVKLVRGLLNVQIIYRNRSDNLLPVKGSVDSDLMRAIDEFQRYDGTARTGLVEPRSATFSGLQKYSLSSHMHVSQNERNFHQKHRASSAKALRSRRQQAPEHHDRLWISGP